MIDGNTTNDVDRIIEGMYRKLHFPEQYDAAFFAHLGKVNIDPALTAENYPANEPDGIRNLFSFLYLAHRLEEAYAIRGIPEDICMDTLHDLVVWTNTHSDLQGTLYLGELSWLKRHLSMRLFRLGRLQFAFGGAAHDAPKYGLAKGEAVIEVHIPEGAPLDPAKCTASLMQARDFFARYFPEYEYKCFTCHSWLLDSALNGLLREDSNILRFAAMFDIVTEDVADDALRYVFQWNTTRENLQTAVCPTEFAKRLKQYVTEGGILHETFGVIRK